MRITSRGPSACRGVGRGNDKDLGLNVATPRAPLGGEVFSRNNK